MGDNLVIDEKPKNKKGKKSLKIRLSVGSSSDAQSYTSEKIEDPEQLNEPYFENLGSPSTRDAIAGRSFNAMKFNLISIYKRNALNIPKGKITSKTGCESFIKEKGC